jgi:hypothetical protein
MWKCHTLPTVVPLYEHKSLSKLSKQSLPLTKIVSMQSYLIYYIKYDWSQWDQFDKDYLEEDAWPHFESNLDFFCVCVYDLFAKNERNFNFSQTAHLPQLFKNCASTDNFVLLFTILLPKPKIPTSKLTVKTGKNDKGRDRGYTRPRGLLWKNEFQFIQRSLHPHSPLGFFQHNCQSYVFDISAFDLKYSCLSNIRKKFFAENCARFSQISTNLAYFSCVSTEEKFKWA